MIALLLLLATVPCKATTNVPEFKANIHKECKPGLVSIDLSGNHDKLVETLVIDKDLTGRDLGAMVGGDDPTIANMTRVSLDGFSAAMASAKIVEGYYHSDTFVWQVRDNKGHPICHFTVTNENTLGRCADSVDSEEEEK